MEENEKFLEDYPSPITIEGTNKILNQLKKCICQIENKLGKGTGFFCYIPYNNEKLKVMITNHHIINNSILDENEKIKVTINDCGEKKIIYLKKKVIYTSELYDTTIIELNSEKDKINNYLELDEEIFEDNINICKKSIYILQYPMGVNQQMAAVSYGIISGIEEDKEYNIRHYCSTNKGSSGSPIIQIFNNKIIGIHKKTTENNKYNLGTLLKYPINEYLKEVENSKKKEPKTNDIRMSQLNIDEFENESCDIKINFIKTKSINKNKIKNSLNKKILIKKTKIKSNEIILSIKVEEKDIKKNIYFLNSDIKENKLKDYKDSIKYYSKLLDEAKIEIFINNVKYTNKRLLNPIKKGTYTIKIKFNSNINNCKYMFYGCSNIA